MNPTQKVTNISCQLPTYCDKGINKLGQVTNIFRNTRFIFFFKSMFLKDVLKFSNPQKKSVKLKMKPTQKVTNITSLLPTYILTNWVKLPIYPQTLDLLSSSNLCFWRNY